MDDRVLRLAVRTVLLDAAGAVLLLSTRDASNPSFGTSWELPGGGVIPGESPAEAATRELREETGLALAVSDLGEPLWHRDVRYTYRGERRLQREAIYVARVRGTRPPIDRSGCEAIEREDHQQVRWWPVSDLQASSARFYPRSLPRHIGTLVSGRVVDEPAEDWEE